jgi:K(+)-stimulated pyrophosphate-energized sodium pump
VLTPVAVGFGLGDIALGGFLGAAILIGQLMAVLLANAGGAWDNAKKYVEARHHGGKGSPAHAAAITGDTVGDPFKDTAGPALNPLIKVINLVALLTSTLVVHFEGNPIRWLIAGGALAVVATAVVISRKEERASPISGARSTA